jgi:hypothetical protein
MPPMESTAKPVGYCHEAAATFGPHMSVGIYHFNAAPQAYSALHVK